MFKNNLNLYPTPPNLAEKLVAKIQRGGKFLDPEAGKGDLLEALKKHGRHFHRHYDQPFKDADIYAIEIDPTLQATLRGKGIKVLDSDFLQYSGPDKFDAIIMNPPFDEGDKHLLKAIDILYRGEISCLLNAETIRNPFSNIRKELVRKLDELGAEIEFIQGAFKSAERKTGVEVAHVYIKIDRKVEDDIFAGCDDHAARCHETVKDKNELSTGRTIEELVAAYNERIRVGTDVIVTYFRHHNKIGSYIGLNKEADKYEYGADDLTKKMQNAINDLLKVARVDFWRRVLSIDEVRKRLTQKKQDEFEHALNERCHMDFTEHNIRQFILNLIGSYEQTLTDAVLDVFDMFTIRHCWDENNLWEKNIHYYNGWKTNKAFKVGKRVVIPIYGSYGGPFFDAMFHRWTLNHKAASTLSDFDKVANYFDGMDSYLSLTQAIEKAFAEGECSGQSTYFKFKCHKKGTIHLEFLDMDVLRRFNVVACRGKGWLPGDYGSKAYAQLSLDEKAIVDSFEGKDSYAKNASRPLFAQKARLQIAA